MSLVRRRFVMSDIVLPGSIEPAQRPALDKGFNPLTVILFAGVLAGALLYRAYSLYADLNAADTQITSHVHSSCCSSHEGQSIEYEEISNRGKTSAENLKVQR
jgi:hypothetical protein